MSLGFLDVSPNGLSAPPSSSSRASPPLPSIQIIKFTSPNATNGLFLRGLLSWYTATPPINGNPSAGIDVDSDRDRLLRRLRGPRSPSLEERGGPSNVEWRRRLIGLPSGVWRQRPQYGWVQELRTMEISRKVGDKENEEGGGGGGEGGNERPRETANAVAEVQDGVIYQICASREAEEAFKAAIPEVDMNESWETDLRDVGAVASWGEHVMLVRVPRERNWRM